MKTGVVSASAAIILVGCSFAPLIHYDSMDFGQTLDIVSNQLLVTNILRARDHAPLHFANLSALRAQFQATGSVQTVFPFGNFERTAPLPGATAGVGILATRASDTNILSLQTAPSFDFAPLDTQEFTRGILQPIDPDVVKYYLDRDLPQELLLFLFIDRVVPGMPTFAGQSAPTVPDKGELINDPQRPDKFKEFADWAHSLFSAYASDSAKTAVIDYPNSHVILANSYVHQIGPPIEGGARKTGNGAGGQSSQREEGSASDVEIKDLVSLDTSKVQIECFDGGAGEAVAKPGNTDTTILAGDTVTKNPAGPAAFQNQTSCNDKTVRYKLIAYSSTHEIIFCAHELYFYVPLALFERKMNYPDAADHFAGMSNFWKQLCTSRTAPGTTFAQVGTIYLRSVEGMIQYLGELIGEEQYAKGDRDALQLALGYTLFNLSPNSKDSRFGVSYEGRHYYVPQYSASDRTILTLALVQQLLNINTNANELPTTRTVEIVP